MSLRDGALVAALAVLVAGTPAAAKWMVGADGRCERVWTPDSLLRGPAAMLSAPTAPVRSAAGVFTYMSPKSGGWGGGGSFYVYGPIVALLSGTAGLVDTTVWLGTGLADTMTGGYWEIAPEEATELSMQPMRPAFSPAPPPIQDRCGRPLTAH